MVMVMVMLMEMLNLCFCSGIDIFISAFDIVNIQYNEFDECLVQSQV